MKTCAGAMRLGWGLPRTSSLCFAWLWVGLLGCGGARPPTRHGAEAAVAAPKRALSRLRFNQLALRLNRPLFWATDRNRNGAVDPDEARTLLFYPSAEAWTDGQAFTPAFEATYAAMVEADRAPPPSDPRRRLVTQELDGVAPTLIETDLSLLPPVHRAFARRMLEVAAAMDRLYAVQTGMEAARSSVAADAASQSLFRRNWGPACLGAATEGEAQCSAARERAKARADVYPEGLAGVAAEARARAADGTPPLCAALEARPDASDLLGPFTVVRSAEPDGTAAPGDAPDLRAVPYATAYASLMRPIAEGLRAAADAMTDPDETELVAYLRAAADAFLDNDWFAADEAWASMNAHNSRWYVRVGPDEVYWEPCSHKAAFHLTLALIDPGSLVWQERLTPHAQAMEEELSSLAGDAYHAREIHFHLPDFIQIVLNAGDDRDAFGATIGQSLPNWGPVARQSRGRTVAMSNLYTDPDSRLRRREVAASLLDAAAAAKMSTDPHAGLLATILHEATHNLGPAHEYSVNDESAAEAFGGGLASMLEELKAQSGALHFLAMLRELGIITEAQQAASYVDSVIWALGHISRGMYTPSGQRKAYSQLAAIQLGFLMDKGAVAWDAEAMAHNGQDRGAFTVDVAAMPAAARDLMREVMRIKALHDRPAAEALAARFIEGDALPQAVIAERHRRQPQTSFVYSLLGG